MLFMYAFSSPIEETINYILFASVKGLESVVGSPERSKLVTLF